MMNTIAFCYPWQVTFLLKKEPGEKSPGSQLFEVMVTLFPGVCLGDSSQR
jgi:hypothetical protein